MTFTLTGFSPVKREEFLLQADFVATLNAELKVGRVEKTITVSGESPVVDVQTAKQQRTLDIDLLQAVPTARGYAAVMLLIPSMIVSGGLGEAEQGGPIVNFIPKTGGNSFQNHFYSSGMSGWMQSSN